MADYPFYARTVIPAGTYDGLDRDTTTVSIRAMLVANELNKKFRGRTFFRAMFLAYLTGECYAAWRFKRSRLQLFLAAAAGFVTVLALVEVACRMLGVAL